MLAFIVFLFIFAIVSIPALIPVAIVYNRKKAKEVEIEKNIKNIEQSIVQSGFSISRKVGKYDWNFESPTYFLYADDVHKKWIITSPFLPEPGKIHSYDDLQGYQFFDEDGLDLEGMIGRGTLSLLGAVAGGLLGGGIGAVLGGTSLNKASKILPGMNGKTKTYGLMVQSKDCDVNSPTLVFDFNTVINPISQLTGSSLQRSSKKYKNNIAVIQEIAEIFDYILRSNQ